MWDPVVALVPLMMMMLVVLVVVMFLFEYHIIFESIRECT